MDNEQLRELILSMYKNGDIALDATSYWGFCAQTNGESILSKYAFDMGTYTSGEFDSAARKVAAEILNSPLVQALC